MGTVPTRARRHTSGAVQRRRLALICGALAAFVAGLLVGRDGARGSADPVDGLTDGQLVGERIIVGFDGHRPPDGLRHRIKRGVVAGVILFSDNYSSKSDARRLIDRLQSIGRPRGLRDPLLVMIDQEGGLVKRLPGAPCCSAEQMGKRSRGFVRDEGRATGRNLRDVGVNVDLAPVLDVARSGSAIGQEDRAFGDSAKRVTAKANAFAAGLEDRGIAATGKHFPGLGAAPANTDFEVQRIHLSKRKLRRTDERPYGRFDRIPGSMVMLSTAIYPAFDRKRPAAFSHRIATRELRDRVGFEGVLITDALDTVSAHDFGGTGKLARAGAKAGTDLLLFTEVHDGARAQDKLKRALKEGRVSRSSFETSARRVLELRSRLRG